MCLLRTPWRISYDSVDTTWNGLVAVLHTKVSTVYIQNLIKKVTVNMLATGLLRDMNTYTCPDETGINRL